MLTMPSSINLSSTIDKPSKASYIIPISVIFLGLTMIVILYVLCRFRYYRRAIRSNVPSRIQRRCVTDITKTLLDTIPIKKFCDKQNCEECPTREDPERGTFTRNIHDSKNARALAHQKTQFGPPSDENEWGHGAKNFIGEEVPNGVSPLGLSYGPVNTVCPICTERFRHAQALRQLPCSHQFHPSCVDPWLLNRSSTCPICRSDICRLANTGWYFRISN